jgi:hypothetical protein
MPLVTRFLNVFGSDSWYGLEHSLVKREKIAAMVLSISLIAVRQIPNPNNH